MGSAIPQAKLGEIVREARSRTGVPAVAAGLFVDGSVELAADGPVTPETPFRVASITKWFTASLVSACGALDGETRRWLSHTADLCTSSLDPLPEVARGLWSYSNAGYVLAGRACAEAAGESYSDAMQARILEPLALGATQFEEPDGAAPGHVQDGDIGHRLAPASEYPEGWRAAGGLWSTAGDLLRFAEHQFTDPYGLQTPQAEALAAEYCLGCWRRELEGGRIAFDHEGSVAGFQSLLLIVPAERLALVVLTNSWRGSGLIRHVVEGLGLVPGAINTGSVEEGSYALGSVTAEVRDGWISEQETDPITGVEVRRKYRVSFDAALMSHRVDFPRPGVARIGWVALPRVS
jgi:CubicO group peptidase (beta-lactamase class C family)